MITANETPTLHDLVREYARKRIALQDVVQSGTSEVYAFHAADQAIREAEQAIYVHVETMVQAEREACAKIAEEYITFVEETAAPSAIAGVSNMIAYHCRARSTNK